jgi:Uma2 family endonuclease
MSNARPVPQISIADYLAMEQLSDVKHEFAAGQVFAMAGASERHNRIAGNMFATLHSVTRKSRCAVYFSDMRVKIDQVIYYPDVIVSCDQSDTDQYLKSNPCLVIEVLSNSTERIDRGEKLYNYQRIAGLKTYMLVAQDAVRVDVYSRAQTGWHFASYADLQDRITLECPATELALADIYERVVIPSPELSGTRHA